MNELPLRDIHLPTDSLWWPPAPGWWMLLVLLILIGLLLPKIPGWLRRKSIRTLSLREFDRIRRTSSAGHLADRQVLQEVSVLLRRTVMSYGARGSDANLCGDRWLTRLNQISGQRCFSSDQCDLLTRGQYQPRVEIDIEALLHSCENWIESLPRKAGHAAD
ncbi:MAG: DUF4381 domain-containing protein [Gammaproteobacteria bacterium]